MISDHGRTPFRTSSKYFAYPYMSAESVCDNGNTIHVFVELTSFTLVNIGYTIQSCLKCVWHMCVYVFCQEMGTVVLGIGGDYTYTFSELRHSRDLNSISKFCFIRRFSLPVCLVSSNILLQGKQIIAWMLALTKLLSLILLVALCCFEKKTK